MSDKVINVGRMQDLPATFAPFVYLVQHGSSPASQVGRAGRHAYNLWEVIDGAAACTLGGDRLTMRSGACFLSEPGVRVQWNAGASYYRIAFDITYRVHRRGRTGGWEPECWRPQSDFQSLFGSRLPYPLPSEAQVLARRLFLQTNAGFWGGAVGHCRTNLAVGEWLLQLLDELRDDHQERPSGALRGDPVDRAETIMRNEFGHGIRVGTVADRLGISRTRLSELFRERHGVGPGTFLRRLRLARVQGDLLDGERTMADIVRRSGFRSVNSLQQCFRRETGLSPVAWLRRQRARRADLRQ